MTIKDVEKLTGLTAKSIRYYESKNLIAVARNEENSYRSYTEEDVNRLRWIKMFRYLDFSIEEIGTLLEMNESEIKEALRQKADAFSKQKNLCDDKQELCLSLAKDYKSDKGVVEEYIDTVEFLESDEMTELMEQLEDYAAPNLISTIAQTFIFMAPVLWLFYNIKNERIDLLMFNSILAVIGTAITTWNWIHYATQYRKQRARIKKKNNKMVWMVPAMLFALVLGIAALVGVMTLIPAFMLPQDYLFFEQGPVTGEILIWLVMIPAILFCILLISKIGKKSVKEMEDVNEDIQRYVEHTYLELEEFDQALVGLSIPKEAEKTGWENCDFDQEYVDRFLRIIEQK